MSGTLGSGPTKAPKTLVGWNLRRLRLDRGLGQVALSKASGVGQQTISGIETGKQDAQGVTLRKLAETLGVHVSAFFAPVGPKAGDASPKGPAPSPDSSEQHPDGAAEMVELRVEAEHLLAVLNSVAARDLPPEDAFLGLRGGARQ